MLFLPIRLFNLSVDRRSMKTRAAKAMIPITNNDVVDKFSTKVPLRLSLQGVDRLIQVPD